MTGDIWNRFATNGCSTKGLQTLIQVLTERDNESRYETRENKNFVHWTEYFAERRKKGERDKK